MSNESQKFQFPLQLFTVQTQSSSRTLEGNNQLLYFVVNMRMSLCALHFFISDFIVTINDVLSICSSHQLPCTDITESGEEITLPHVVGMETVCLSQVECVIVVYRIPTVPDWFSKGREEEEEVWE